MKKNKTMKKNKKTNKFKLVKWKNKLLPILVGTFIFLIPLIIITTRDKKSNKSSSQKTDKNSVKKEKIRIQGLSKQTITKSVIKVNANSLTAQELGIDKGKIEGVKHTITHKEVTSDTNDLDVSIDIKKGSQTLTTTMKVKIIGINATKDIETVKALFNSLENPSNGKYVTDSTLKDASTTLPSKLSSQTTPETIGFEDPSKGKRNGVNVSFQVKNHSNAVGTLTVEVTLSKNQGKTEKFEFILKGYKVDTGNLVAITQQNVNQIIEEVRETKIKLSSKYYIKINEKINWPKHLSMIKWGKVQGLTKYNTPFKGDISNFYISWSKLKDVDVSQVTNWPKNLQGINWEGVKGLTRDNTLFKNDISHFDITWSKLKDVDVAQVTQWPRWLQGIQWEGVKGLNNYSTPFKGNISKLNIEASFFKGVDVSQVTNWPKDLSSINWEGIKGLTKDSTPFKGDISDFDIIGYGSIKVVLKGINVSQVTNWPKDLSWINWEGIKGLTKDSTPFKGDISDFYISYSELKDVNVSQVTNWPTNLYSINWEGIKGLTKDSTPFKGDISGFNITGHYSTKVVLKGINVSQVTNWPKDLSWINWEGVKGLTQDITPFKNDISKFYISGSNLKGIDVSQVTQWPKDLMGINWEGIRGLNKDNTPFKDNIFNLNICGRFGTLTFLKGIDVSQVTQWPRWLQGIQWEGVKRLKKEKTPFKGDISNFYIYGSILKGVDVSQVTRWPTNLSGINWEGVQGLKKEKTPFKGDISKFDIYGSIFKSVDVSQVTKWPINLLGINW